MNSHNWDWIKSKIEKKMGHEFKNDGFSALMDELDERYDTDDWFDLDYVVEALKMLGIDEEDI